MTNPKWFIMAHYVTVNELRTRQARNTHLHDEKEAQQDKPTLRKNTKRVHFEAFERWDVKDTCHVIWKAT